MPPKRRGRASRNQPVSSRHSPEPEGGNQNAQNKNPPVTQFTPEMLQQMQGMFTQAVQAAVQAMVPTVVAAIQPQTVVPPQRAPAQVPMPVGNTLPVGVVPDNLPPIPMNARVVSDMVKVVNRTGGKKFGGRVAPIEAKSWLDQTSEIFDTLQLADLHRITVVSSLLFGPALTWWRRIKEKIAADQLTWDFFTQAFEKEYYSHKAHARVRNEFDGMRQNGSPAGPHMEQMRELARQLPDYVTNDEILVDKIRQSLDLDLQMMVSGPGDPTIDQFVDSVLTMEKLLARQKEEAQTLKRKKNDDSESDTFFRHKSKFSFNKGAISRSSTFSFPRSDRTFERNINNGNGKNAQPIVSQASVVTGSRKCWRCGQEGHYKKDCPNKGGNTIRAGMSYNRENEKLVGRQTHVHPMQEIEGEVDSEEEND